MSKAVPEGWTIQALDGKVHILSGFPFKSSLFTDDSDFMGVIRIRDLEKQSIETFYAGDFEETYVVRRGDILIGMDGDFNIVKWNAKNALLNQRVCKVKADVDSSFDTEFLFQSLKDDLLSINAATGATTVKHLSVKDIRGIEKAYPPLPEQQKIANILSSVDDVIEKTRAQIDKLKDLKTGMMQELLTKGIGHTEFKDSPVGRIPAAWDVVHLESLVSIMESGWSPQCESVPAKGCEWAVLKTTAVSWDGFDFRANKKLPDELEPRPKIQVEVHDILITRAGPAERVGVVSYVEHVPKRIMLSDKLIRIKAHHNQNPQFLSFWLSTEFVKNYFSQRTTGLAQSQTNISQDILKSLLCVVPPLAEQEMISSTIDALEKQLMTKRNILSHYEKTKKALMQDLLTGKVRVNITDKESAVV